MKKFLIISITILLVFVNCSFIYAENTDVNEETQILNTLHNMELGVLENNLSLLRDCFTPTISIVIDGERNIVNVEEYLNGEEDDAGTTYKVFEFKDIKINIKGQIAEVYCVSHYIKSSMGYDEEYKYKYIIRLKKTEQGWKMFEEEGI